jgi:FHS family L-fucose permease-like MFS transporter
MYVGAQVGTWSYFIQYVQDYTHRPEKLAGYFLTGTLFAFGIGRFASSALMGKVSAARLMGIYSIINVGLLAVAAFVPGRAGLWTIFLSSFFMSVMYPTIFALGIEGLGENTKIAASLLTMSIIGGAVLTPIMGLISQRTGSIAHAYAVPLIGYIFVALYAFWGAHLRPLARQYS